MKHLCRRTTFKALVIAPCFLYIIIASTRTLAQGHFGGIAHDDNSRIMHNSSDRLFHFQKGPCVFDMGFVMRGYYLNDQRIEWSGNECTMGAEGILTPTITHNQNGKGRWSFNGEFLIQDILNDNAYIGGSGGHDNFIVSEERQSYMGNFNHRAVEVSQLNIRYTDPYFEFRAGKIESPFGNYHTPLMSNSRWDAPFIRAEAILWRDTGFLFRFTPSVFDTSLAITNGCEGYDTNSMKAIIGRVGLDFQNVKLGISGLLQDGIGSEEQKENHRHVGVDASVRLGNWLLSSEVIYDEYGLRRSGFDPNDIFWRKSIYYRQINKRPDATPIVGWGGYIDLTYHHHPWFISFNYGEYHPEQLRNPDYPQHDIVNRRFLVKLGWNFTKNLQWYNAALIETGDYVAQDGRLRKGYAFMSGVKLEL